MHDTQAMTRQQQRITGRHLAHRSRGVTLVESLAYNLLSVRQLAIMGFATFFDIDTVALLWSKTLKLAFVGHVENGLYVINF